MKEGINKIMLSASVSKMGKMTLLSERRMIYAEEVKVEIGKGMGVTLEFC